VKLPREVYEGLEIIRQSGATNMLDKPTVTDLAREWGLEAPADWLENVDTGIYGHLIISGPEIIPSDATGWELEVVRGETLDEKLDRLDREYDEERRGFWEWKKGQDPIDPAVFPMVVGIASMAVSLAASAPASVGVAPPICTRHRQLLASGLLRDPHRRT